MCSRCLLPDTLVRTGHVQNGHAASPGQRLFVSAPAGNTAAALSASSGSSNARSVEPVRVHGYRPCYFRGTSMSNSEAIQYEDHEA